MPLCRATHWLCRATHCNMILCRMDSRGTLLTVDYANLRPKRQRHRQQHSPSACARKSVGRFQIQFEAWEQTLWDTEGVRVCDRISARLRGSRRSTLGTVFALFLAPATKKRLLSRNFCSTSQVNVYSVIPSTLATKSVPNERPSLQQHYINAW